MRRNLPPFAALKAFELAALHNSFRAAAIEACQTPSAISHQIRTLELFLNVKLFNRERGKSKLTQAGEEYLATVDRLFSELEEAGLRLNRYNDPGTLRVGISHSLASCWLLPLLPSYQKAYPDMDIKLVNSDPLSKCNDINLDLEIRYGKGQWGGMKAEFLMHEELFIVCHPKMLAQLPSADKLDQLADKYPLIHYSDNTDEWHNWLKDAGVSQPNIKHRIELDSRQLVMQAVASGLGLGVGRASYASDLVNKGLLALAYPQRKASDNGYYLVTESDRPKSQKVENFSNWLLNQSHQTNRLIGAAPI